MSFIITVHGYTELFLLFTLSGKNPPSVAEFLSWNNLVYNLGPDSSVLNLFSFSFFSLFFSRKRECTAGTVDLSEWSDDFIQSLASEPVNV